MSRRTREQWQLAINEQQTSGLSISQYCREHQIKPQTFYARRSALKKQNSPAVTTHSSDFVKVANASLAPALDAIYIKTHQATIQLPTDTSPQWLGQFMREWSA